MDDIISILIFVAIVAISILSKVKSERKAAQDREEEAQQPPVAPKDLPEPLRRILFGEGEGDIIIAKPKEPQPTQRTPERPREMPPSTVPARQVVIERPAAAPLPPRPLPREQAPATTPSRAQQRVRQTAPPRQQPSREHIRTQPSQRPVLSEAARPHPKTVRAPKPVGFPAQPSAEPQLASLLRSRSGLTQGILLREILGPPRAFDI